MAIFRLFPVTNGPSIAVNFSGHFISGMHFFVTGEAWFEGYWWWVCPSGQSTEPVKCALWQAYTTDNATLVPGSVVTSDELTAGQWNWIPLQAPLPLSIGAAGTAVSGAAEYVAAIGCNGPFPDTMNSFGSGDTYQEGIVQGPLSAYSALPASLPSPLLIDQGVFTSSGSDPALVPPLESVDTHDNFWVDVQVTDSAPADVCYRLWPGFPTIPPTDNDDEFEQTMGTEFTLSEACTLSKIWFYSPPGATALPTRCGIWNVASQDVVEGTDNTSPTWSGAAASGWVSCSYSDVGVTLPMGDYKVTVYTPGGTGNFYEETEEYFGGNGPAAPAGITYGPLSAPNTTNATPPGQTTFQHDGWEYPDTYDTEFDGQNRWVDVEVIPAPPSPAPASAGAIVATFFP